MLQPEIVPFIEVIPGAIFQQVKARPRVAKSIRDFCSAQQMRLLRWPAYSPDMSPFKHVWDLVGRRLARNLARNRNIKRRTLDPQASNVEYTSTRRHSKSA